jgi:BolA protein
MDRQAIIQSKLQAAFAPEALKVENESALHHGHEGAGTDTHFRVMIVSLAFEGKSRLERHRMVNEALAIELAGSLHALTIRALTPAEARGLEL